MSLDVLQKFSLPQFPAASGIRALREIPERTMSIYPALFQVISWLPDGIRAEDGTQRIIMTTRRSSGPGAQAAKAALKKPAEAMASLYPEILKGMPVGVLILHLESPRDPRTFRIIDINPAAASLTGTTLEDLRGKTLADFPNLLKTQLPVPSLVALQAGEPRNLGKLTYGDELIREGTYSVRVFPRFNDYLGFAFQ